MLLRQHMLFQLQLYEEPLGYQHHQSIQEDQVHDQLQHAHLLYLLRDSCFYIFFHGGFSCGSEFFFYFHILS